MADPSLWDEFISRGDKVNFNTDLLEPVQTEDDYSDWERESCDQFQKDEWNEYREDKFDIKKRHVQYQAFHQNNKIVKER